MIPNHNFHFKKKLLCLGSFYGNVPKINYRSRLDVVTHIPKPSLLEVNINQKSKEKSGGMQGDF